MKLFLSISLFSCLVIIGCYQEHHNVELIQVHSLAPFLTPIHSIDPADTSFTDLEPLKRILKDKKIVMLGEQSHGDGATFLAKARLVKFLHQEMGFDVFAIESGMFECELAGKLILNGTDPGTAVKNSTFDIWTASQQFKPVIDYIAQTQRSSHPLHYSGFDLQITGRYGRDSLAPLLRKFVSGIFTFNKSDSLTLQWIDTLTKKIHQFRKISDTAQHSFFYSGIRSIIRKIEHSSNSEKTFWIQELRSIETFARFLWNVDWNNPDPKYMNLRDRQMGENLLWLSRVRYPNRKIIVWAASSHISRNRHEIVNRKNADSKMVPMGHHVWKGMGDSVYTMAFTAYDGTMGVRGKNGTVLAKAKAGTLEDIIEHTGNEFAFLDFQQLPDNHWMRDTVRARPFGYSTMLARWPEMMDGMFYTKHMTPSVEIEKQ